MALSGVKDNKCLEAIAKRYTYTIESLEAGAMTSATWTDSTITESSAAIATFVGNANSNIQIMTYVQTGVVGLVVINNGSSAYANKTINVVVI